MNALGGFLLAWTPYAIVVFIRILIDKNHFPPMMSTLPALFAKSSVVYVKQDCVIRSTVFDIIFHHRLDGIH